MTPHINKEQRELEELTIEKKLEYSKNISHAKCRIKQINLNNMYFAY